MNKREFIENMMRRVKDVKIEEFIKLKSSVVRNKALCPFHGDKRIGSFVFSNEKGIFKCFSCGVAGDGIRFISLLEGTDYLHTAFNLALYFRIISHDEYNEYFTKRKYKAEEIRRIEKIYTKKEEEKKVSKKAPEIYEIFANLSPLNDEDRQHLLEERMISEENLDNYFSFPSRKIMKKFLSELEEKNISLSELKSTPGFYYDKKNDKFTFVRYNGLGIKIKNYEGKVIGIQIRKRQESSPRYVWFSSNFANFQDGLDHGTSSGSPVDTFLSFRSPTITVTEGHFKAYCLNKVGFNSISIQGVTAWKRLCEEIKNIVDLPEYKKLYMNHLKLGKKPQIYLCFDADVRDKGKKEVKAQVEKIKVEIESKFKDLFDTYYILWDEKYKGIDDLILNNEDYYKKIQKKTHL